MTRALDPRFRLILAFMDGATTNLERAAARENAEAVARDCGFTFDEAMALVRGPAESRQMSSSPADADDPSHLLTPRD